MTALTARLRQARPLVGTLMTMASPDAAEVLADTAIGWIFVDLEHSPVLDTTQVQRIAQAVAGRCYVVVRVPANDGGWIKRVLDTGVDGVIVPHVQSTLDARRAVLAAKYPPLGARSVGIARAQRYGADLAGYLDTANDRTALILQVEDVTAVDAIDDILAVPGFDAVFVGPYDLSGSMHKLGQIDDPAVHAAVARVLASCRAARLPTGIFAGTPARALTAVRQGIGFVAVGTDLGLLAGAAKKMLSEVSTTVMAAEVGSAR